jgi:hypothetical protein
MLQVDVPTHLSHEMDAGMRRAEEDEDESDEDFVGGAEASSSEGSEDESDAEMIEEEGECGPLNGSSLSLLYLIAWLRGYLSKFTYVLKL